ncbi:ATP-NAD kinase family protein [Mycolicibacterium sp.]|uniref:ATP-NAD kinase family protein n=1 Tax=Mycolicibacterium sp. TaxID=2320850 RepID=UPI003D12E6A3
MTTGRLGLIINPIAGMGGRVGLHGTDGESASEALARGAAPVAELRAARTLTALRASVSKGDIDVVAAGGRMGSAVLSELAIPHTVVHQVADTTSAADTRAAVEAMASHGVDLLLVVGGDGTMRDVAAVAPARRIATLGVPAGVKMHSSVFATSPEVAAEVTLQFLNARTPQRLHHGEVVDNDSGGPELFAVLQVPAAGTAIQSAKSVSRKTSDDSELLGLAREVVEEMEVDRLYLVGPGSTVDHLCTVLGLRGTLMGVDAIVNGSMVARDLNERQILDLVTEYDKITLIIGVVGGQGFLLGRGNQQLSARVMNLIGAENTIVLAARTKLAGLDPAVLRIDVGDRSPHHPLRGYQRIRVARGESTVLRIVV